MLTAKQFSEKVGVSKPTVIKWIRKGKIDGVVRVKDGKGKPVWRIPENTMRPESRFYHDGKATEQKRSKISLPAGDAIDQEHKMQLDFVNTHLTWSVRSIAHNLGVSTGKVRELFDELLSMGGGMDE